MLKCWYSLKNIHVPEHVGLKQRRLTTEFGVRVGSKISGVFAGTILPYYLVTECRVMNKTIMIQSNTTTIWTWAYTGSLFDCSQTISEFVPGCDVGVLNPNLLSRFSIFSIWRLWIQILMKSKIRSNIAFTTFWPEFWLPDLSPGRM